MGHARGIGAEFRSLGCIWLPKCFAKTFEFPVVLDREKKGFAVGTIERAIRRYGWVLKAWSSRLLAAIVILHEGDVHPVGEGVEKGDLDLSALAR